MRSSTASRSGSRPASPRRVRPGERVAALLFNTPEFPLLWFGVAKARAVLVPLNTGLKGEILRYELADSTPVAIVVDRRLWPAYAPVRESVRIPREYVVEVPPDDLPSLEGVARFDDLPTEPQGDAPPAPAPHDPASVMYTSGTTGPPKGAIIPHQKLISTPRRSRCAAASARTASCSPASRSSTAMPRR